MKIFLIGLFGAWLLRFVNYTLRWERIGLDGDEQWWADKKPSILMCWHGRQLFLPWIYLRHRSSQQAPALTALVSQHNDGRMVAECFRNLGVESIAGSSSRGGLRALHLMIKKLKSHSHVGITPDGPKGPARQIKNGVLIIAQRSGAAIHPCTYAAKHYWKFSSWDGMIFPKPFSRAVMIKGPAITIQENTTEDELASVSLSVQHALNEITVQADNYFMRQQLLLAPSSMPGAD